LMQHYLGEDEPDSAVFPTGDINHAAVACRGALLCSDHVRPDSRQNVKSMGSGQWVTSWGQREVFAT